VIIRKTEVRRPAPPFEGGPIRTADGFRTALDRAGVIQNDDDAAEEFDRIAAAVRAAPFLIQAGRIVAKGFTPRVVCAD
jgi:hypothetical protein